MSGNGNFTKDPLDLARSQMDFARMAADAPSSKEILFKAQTIIPSTPSKPAWQKGAPLAGAALAAGLLFTPMLPDDSSLDRLSVNFEGSMQRSEAQQLEFDIRNALPADILMGREFSAAGSESAGRLTLVFTAAGEPRLESMVTRVVDSTGGDRSPLYGKTVNEARVSSRDSIVRRVTAMFAADSSQIDYIDPDNHTASELLRRPELILAGLNGVLQHEGYAARSVEFIDRQPQVADKADYRVIELAAWPRPMRVVIDTVDLASFEHEALRQSCVEWLDSVNLGTDLHGLVRHPGELLPIMVQVKGLDGIYDRAMTQKLQAMIIQPTKPEFTDTSTWDVQAAVKPPLVELMGERVCRVSYEQVDDPAYNRDVNFFWVEVTMTDSFEKQQKLDRRVEKLEQTIDF